MKMKDKIITGLFFLTLIMLGWFGNESYRAYSSDRVYNGLMFQEATHSDALATAKEYDEYGDWVCINSKGMTYKECVETAQHECGHEIFAEYCEDEEKCFKLAEMLENE